MYTSKSSFSLLCIGAFFCGALIFVFGFSKNGPNIKAPSDEFRSHSSLEFAVEKEIYPQFNETFSTDEISGDSFSKTHFLADPACIDTVVVRPQNHHFSVTSIRR